MTRDELKDVLREAAQLGYFGGMGLGSAAPSTAAPTPGPSSSGFANSLKNAGEVAGQAASAMAGAFKKAADGGLKFSDLSGLAQGLGSSFGRVVPFADTLGKSLGGVGEYAQQSVDRMRDFSKVGAGFGGDAMAMRESIAGTRMGFDEYSRFLRDNARNLTAFGGTATEGAKAFNNFSKEFFDTQAADKLRLLGYTTEELNGALGLSISARRNADLREGAGREEALRSAAALATEMDAVARLTGKSREEQQRAIQSAQADVQARAAIDLAIRRGGKFAEEGFTAVTASLQRFGGADGPVGKLTRDLMAFGGPTKETAATMSALGPAGAELSRAIAAVKTAKTEEEKEAALARVRRAQDSIAAVQQSDTFKQQVAIGAQGFVDIAKGSAEYNAGLQKYAAENKLNLSDSAQRARAVAGFEAQAAAERKQAAETAKGGTKAVSDSVILTENRLRDFSASLQTNLMKPLGELGNKLGDINKQLGNQKFLGAPEGPSARQVMNAQTGDLVKGIVEQADKVTQKQREREDKAAGVSPETVERIQNKPPQQRTPEENEILRRREQKESRESGANFGLGDLFRQTPGNVRIVPGSGTPPTAAPTIPTRDVGTLGMTGQLFEKQDFFGKVAKGETVMTPEQLTNLVKGVKGSGIESAVQAFTGSMKPMSGAATPKMPSIDIGKIGKDITTSLSVPPVTGIVPSNDPSKQVEDKFTTAFQSIDFTNLKNSVGQTFNKLAENTKNIIPPADKFNDLSTKLTTDLTKSFQTIDLSPRDFSDISKQIEKDIANFKTNLNTDLSNNLQSVNLDTTKLTENLEFQPGNFDELKIAAEKSLLNFQNSFDFTKLDFSNFGSTITENFLDFGTNFGTEISDQLALLESARDDFESSFNDYSSLFSDVMEVEQAVNDDRILDLDQQLQNLDRQTSVNSIDRMAIQIEKQQAEKDMELAGERRKNLLVETVNLANKEEQIRYDVAQMKLHRDAIEKDKQLDKEDLEAAETELAQINDAMANTQDAVALNELEMAKSAKLQEVNELKTRIASEEQKIIDKNSEIALRELELNDTREELAEADAAYIKADEEYYDAKERLITAQLEEVLAQPEPEAPAFDEMAGVDEAIARQQRQQAEVKTPGTSSAYKSMIDKVFGSFTPPSKATAEADAAKANLAQKASAPQTESTKSADKTQSTSKPVEAETKKAPAAKEATLTDLHRSLELLNKQMGQLIAETNRVAETATGQLRATKGLSKDGFART